MSYFVYVLQSLKDNKYYIGSTSNVEARLLFHNNGFQRSTRYRLPFKLLYYESFDSMKEALIRESKSRITKVETLLKN